MINLKTALEEFIGQWEFKQECALIWDEISFPEMRRVAARTIGIELIQVQPMSAPQEHIHYVDYVYDQSECPIQSYMKREENEKI